MKTPREILLQRHQAIRPKLDALRREVLAAELGAGNGPRARAWSWLGLAWRELIWPCRHAWAGLAAVWTVLLALQLSPADRSANVARRAPEASAEVILAFWRQETALAELIQPGPPRAATRPRPIAPQPRSQGHAQFLTV